MAADCGHVSFLLAALSLAKGVSLEQILHEEKKWVAELFQRHFMSLELLVISARSAPIASCALTRGGASAVLHA